MMDSSLQRKMLEAIEQDVPAVLVTVVSAQASVPTQAGARMLVYPDGSTLGTVGGGELELRATRAALAATADQPVRVSFDLGQGQPGADATGMVCGGTVELLIEPLVTPHRLYIAGGGHCGVELSSLASRVGFHVTVIDDRPEWASPEKHPAADKVACARYAEIRNHVSFSDRTYIVIMTHGHAHDEEVLRACLREPHAYLGMIGSEQKVRRCFERLEADGFTTQELASVFAPVGFPIGSMTPAEIAVSIAAQLVAVRKGRRAVVFSSNPLGARAG